jgi:hypothetical protein
VGGAGREVAERPQQVEGQPTTAQDREERGAALWERLVEKLELVLRGQVEMGGDVVDQLFKAATLVERVDSFEIQWKALAKVGRERTKKTEQAPPDRKDAGVALVEPRLIHPTDECFAVRLLCDLTAQLEAEFAVEHELGMAIGVEVARQNPCGGSRRVDLGTRSPLRLPTGLRQHDADPRRTVLACDHVLDHPAHGRFVDMQLEVSVREVNDAGNKKQRDLGITAQSVAHERIV